jgi:hypothetical protein
VILTFGSAVGLSLVSPWTSTASSAKWLGALAVFWVIAQQIGSLLCGRLCGRAPAHALAGALPGRDRIPRRNAWRDNVGHRGGHRRHVGGLRCRAIGRVATDVTGKAVQGAANVDPMSYQIDVLLRPGAQATAPAGDPVAVRSEMTRILVNAATSPNGLTQADRTYLAQVVAQRTGLPPQEAEARVTQVANEALLVAKDAADRARKTAVAAGFLTAANLLLSLAAAWWAAQRGGDHRDTSRAARFY